jgi:hypothetical protein
MLLPRTPVNISGNNVIIWILICSLYPKNQNNPAWGLLRHIKLPSYDVSQSFWFLFERFVAMTGVYYSG